MSAQITERAVPPAPSIGEMVRPPQELTREECAEVKGGMQYRPKRSEATADLPIEQITLSF